MHECLHLVNVYFIMPFCPLPSQPSLLAKTVILSKTPAESAGPTELWEDDLAGKIQNEYDPMIPNNFEMIVKKRRAEERSRDNEVCGTVSCCLFLSCFEVLYIMYINYFLNLVVVYFRVKIRWHIFLCCVCPCVWGHLGVWGELANYDSLTHRPISQGWAPECPLGSIFNVYFVLLPRMVSGSGLPFFLPYMS